MNLHIRPPQGDEFRICRMLLPETFVDGVAREYLLCLRDQAPRIVAAASFRSVPDGVTHLRVHVVRSFRRRGVGSQVLAYIARRGVRTLEGTAEIAGTTCQDSGIEAFCRRNRFERTDALTTVEAEIAGMREYARGLRARLAPPADVRVVRLADAPADQVAELHARHVAHDNEASPWRALVARGAAMEHSPVVMADRRVAGILLWELAGQMAVVRSRVVAPEFRGGWVNAALLAEGLDGAWAGGARRVSFSYNESNRDTRKLAARFRADVASVVGQFTRKIEG